MQFGQSIKKFLNQMSKYFSFSSCILFILTFWYVLLKQMRVHIIEHLIMKAEKLLLLAIIYKNTIILWFIAIKYELR